LSVDAVAAMRSRPSGTSWRSGYPRQADRGDLLPLSDATVKSRGKPPSTGRSVGRPRDPLQETADVVTPRGVPHVGDICKGRLRPGQLQRI